MEFRIKQVRAQQGLDKAAARRYIDQVDAARTRRLLALFGTDWRDPSRYDLALNMGQMSLDVATHLIVEVVRHEDYRPTAASEQDFQNLSLAVRVQAELMMSPRLRNFNVRAEQGQVHVAGVLTQSVSEQEIIRLIERVPGVAKVVTDIKSPQEYAVD